jgi:hypothetical protein
MFDDVIELYNAQKRYREVYELSVNIGSLESSFQLLLDHKLLDWAPQAQLGEIFNYIQARCFLEKCKSKKQIRWPAISARLNGQMSSVDNTWERMVEAWNNFIQSPGSAPVVRTNDSRMRGFFDIIVCWPLDKTNEGY